MSIGAIGGNNSSMIQKAKGANNTQSGSGANNQQQDNDKNAALKFGPNNNS